MLSKVHSTQISRISRPAMLYIHARKCYVTYVVKIWIFWVKYDLISDVEKATNESTNFFLSGHF